MSVAVISHPDCLLHDMGFSHPEQPARILAIEQALVRTGLDKILKKYDAPFVTREQLLRVHSEKYINYIFNSAPNTGLFPLDADTWMNPYTLAAAQRAAGALVHAVDLVMSKEVSSAFCNIRPPGHHAERTRAMGFCFFNNIAVGVAHALEHHHLNRIAIIDFDVHHGNGTEDIFKNEERVLFCSSFEHPFYPFKGADTISDHIINIPLKAGTAGHVFREKVEQLWLPRVKKFNPEMIFFSAGFDAYHEDYLADLMLVEEDYFWITQQIKKIATDTCEGRMVSTLEGGYNLEGLGRCAVAHIKGLME
jgi:acetoin utilization deacetylase AcuC-like enzyme